MSEKKKSIFQQATAKVAKLLKLDFATISAEDGTMLYVDGEAIEGANVYVLTETGDYQIAPDGVYVADGVSYTVSNGTITNVSTQDASEEFEVEVEEAPESTGEVTSEDLNQVVEVVNDLLDVVREQDAEIESLNEAVIELESELKKAKKETNGAAATTQTYSRKTDAINFADQKMKKLIQNFK